MTSMGSLKVLGAAAAGGVVGAALHELSHMAIPWWYGVETSLEWRPGLVLGAPTVRVIGIETIPDWALASAGLAPLSLFLAYGLLAWLGATPRRPWEIDTPSKGAAILFLLAAIPSARDIDEALNALGWSVDLTSVGVEHALRIAPLVG